MKKSDLAKAEAVIVLQGEARGDRLSRTAYRRVLRALDALGLDAANRESVLESMDYHEKGQPREFVRDLPKPNSYSVVVKEWRQVHQIGRPRKSRSELRYGYRLATFAQAVGVTITGHPTRKAAQTAASRITEHRNDDGVYALCAVAPVFSKAEAGS